MPEMSTESVQCVVFADSAAARAYGKGGIWFRWIEGSDRRFPDDVQSVMICMPVNWGEADVVKNYVVAEWAVSYRNVCGAQWSLSGTIDKPTLSPSLNWVGVWHGFLTDGYLASC